MAYFRFVYDVVDSELEVSVGAEATNLDFGVKDDILMTLILHYLVQYTLRNTLFRAYFNISLEQIAQWFNICFFIYIPIQH